MTWNEETVRWAIGVAAVALGWAVAYVVKRFVTQRDARLEAKHYTTRIDLPNADLGVVHLKTRNLIHRPWLVELVLKNRGPGGLKAADMNSGNLSVRLGTNCRVVAVAGIWVDGQGIPYDPSFIGQEWFNYPAVNIRKGSRASVRLICSGTPDISWMENLPDATLSDLGSGDRQQAKPIPGFAVGVASLIGAILSFGVATRDNQPLWFAWIAVAICIYGLWQSLSYWWDAN